MTPAAKTNDLRIGELATKLATDSARLFQQEAELAKREVNEEIHRATKQTITMATGGAVLYAGLLALIAAAILGLGAAMPMWLAALVVGVVVAAAGAALLQRGKREIREVEVVPTGSIERAKRDIRIVKEAAQ